MPPRRAYLLVALALLLVEVLIATKLSHYRFVRSSLGDVLVTPLVYFAVLAVRELDRVRLAVAVLAFACLVEATQYLSLAQMLGLKPGSPLRIVLGDAFSWGDIACYAVGCAVAVALDARGGQSLR